jgi:hypothetical protein
MAKKFYEIQEGKKYTGKHKVYVAGNKIDESELFGNEKSIEAAIKSGKIKQVGRQPKGGK